MVTMPVIIWNTVNRPGGYFAEGKGLRISFRKIDATEPDKNRLHIVMNLTRGHKGPLEKREQQVGGEVDRINGIEGRKQTETEKEADAGL